jgi:pimeloyl-ACP methyl ester carboxylesterase
MIQPGERNVMSRLRTTLLTAILTVGGVTVPATQASAATQPVYFVHGYNDSGGSNCESIWANAIDYFRQQGKDRGSLKTVAYYKGDSRCDVDVANATTDTRIKHVAAAFANYIYDKHTSKGESVEIVAHSMGGLVTRVAMLGSAKGWEGFPAGKLKVSDVVTLATPHQGIIDTDKYDSTQWDSMVPGSTFMDVLHEPANRLSEPWAADTDWSFVSSDEDKTVDQDSAIDKGYHADHKYRYLPDADYDISHTNIRLFGPGRAKFNLRYWHASEGDPHDTTNGWAPLETAYNALSRNSNW